MSTEKRSFIIRIDTETLAAIEKWAADDFRSANGQIEWILSEALKKAKRCSTRYTHPSGLGNPATRQAPRAGPKGKSS
jgi:hypothetical protein